jgi:pimeloyl-ACP methyl ester carboxylesterase
MTALVDGMASLSLGAGPPLLLLPGLTPDHAAPRALARRLAFQQMRPYAAQRQVWWVGRRRGLARGATMADLAHDYATALRAWGEEPIDVVGISTGGSVGLQLAADHPELVNRLVLVASACRLGPRGRAGQRQVLAALEHGDHRGAAAQLLSLTAGGPVAARLLAAAGWALPGAVVGRGDPDLLATLRAEDAFDLTDRLDDVEAPTLVVGGEDDAVHGADLFRETAHGLRRGKAVVYPGAGHAATVTHRRLAADVLGFLDRD